MTSHLLPWMTQPFQNEVYPYKKEFAPPEQILCFKGWLQLEKETKTNMLRLASSLSIPICLI